MTGAALAAAIAAAVALAAAALLAILWLRERGRVRALAQRLAEERRRGDDAAGAGEAFFNVVNHELRSPIAAILGYQELLGDGAYGQLGDGAAEPVDRIGRSARHLLHLVDGVVDLSRVRAGTALTAAEPIDLGALLGDVERDLRHHAGERHIRFSVHIAPVHGPFRTDRDRLARALHLLVVAAVKNAARDIELHAESVDGELRLTIAGARFQAAEGPGDIALRCGIRIAIAQATADLLGGRLDVVSTNEGAASEIRLRVPDAGPL